ncbi:MAG: hypothetical protein K5768_08720 [Firmicutes bacterium]|nr:hypothetical protein [Bacillota bacterium]
MITPKDIQTAVCTRLKENGYTVFATEVKEGFQKPACFVGVFPVSVELQNANIELVTSSVVISYYPMLETREELVTNAGKIKNIFLYSPLHLGNRFLNVNAITFDAEDSALLAQFDIEYLQETNRETEKLPMMEKYSERTMSYGTS